MNELAREKPTTGMTKSENITKYVSPVINPTCSNNNEEGGNEVQMSSINDSKEKNASSERQSSAKKRNDTKSGSKKYSWGTGSAGAQDKCSLTVRAQVVESAAVLGKREGEMAKRAEAKKDGKENAKVVKTIAKGMKGASENTKLKSKDTRLNAKNSEQNAKDAKLNAEDRGTPKYSTIHNAKHKSWRSPSRKNTPMKLSSPKKNDSKEVASVESTSVAASRHSAHAQMNQKETEQINLNRNKKKVSEIGEKRTNKARCAESCKVRKEEHQSKNQKSNTIKQKIKLNCTVINEIQMKNNIYICKFKNKLNKMRKYFFPIYMYGEASIARNKALLLKIHMHTCLYCQNGILCNFVENYTL
ncbi:hypothetical protein AK88_04820 [Plasmodium fragile]|uniref:Uncharacterized protein n=1 Tax=Plasmodium fragile TaxID=5857 RepID=A0A0D9QEX5_PLAFR|nr:uncharacterized protein AK88_04820 [Plasmodium fragile]KJP85554.1 hypothetical protein AK88_04820 [Plasmodium fragile]